MRKEYPPDGPLWSYVPLFCVCCALQQSLAKPPAEKSRSKKSKEPKPRVKKLKYHQYIPPDQKQELNEAPMDSAYARLLQQQQQFLQLQILNQQKQQQQQYNYQASKLKYGSIKLYFIAVGIFLILITITSTLIQILSQTYAPCYVKCNNCHHGLITAAFCLNYSAFPAHSFLHRRCSL